MTKLQLDEGIIRIKEQCEFVAYSHGPEDQIKREDNQPIAIFNFTIDINLNALSDDQSEKLIITTYPLEIKVIDVELMRATYMPNLSHKSTCYLNEPITTITAAATSILSAHAYHQFCVNF